MTYDLYIGDYAYSSWSLRGWLLVNRFGLSAQIIMIPFANKDVADQMSDIGTLIQSAISDIREVKKPLIDNDGVCSWNTIWVRKFEESTKPKHKFSSSFSNYIDYMFKTDHHAQKHGIDAYVPSVFPHDLHPALLHKSCPEDSPHESSVIAGDHEQLDPYELQDQELVTLQSSAEAAWFAVDLV